jgi:type IV pilus assembly protein PilO
MALELPKIDLEVLRTTPMMHKLGVVGILAAFIIIAFYDNYGMLFESWTDKGIKIEALQADNAKLDSDIQALTIKVKHLDELIAASKQLEIELAKKKERLPPQEEAVMLLKQLSDLGVRLGLDIRLWKPGNTVEDPSKLFVRMPVNVEVAGGYHTAALFFDRINKMPRIMNVNDLKMGSSRVEQDHVVIQTVFELTAFVAPPEPKPVAQPAPVPAAAKK